MAFVISVVLLKGGVSKTTTALALGEAAALSMPVVIVDMDPMRSLARWSELAAAAGRPLRSEVVPMPGPACPGAFTPSPGTLIWWLSTRRDLARSTVPGRLLGSLSGW